MALPGKSIDFLFNQIRAYQGSLAGGTVAFYSPGNTTTLVPVYLDINLQQVAANPYMLSADGTAELFANGLYRVIFRNAQGVIVFDYDQVEIRPTPDTTGGGGGGGGTNQVVHLIKSCLNADLPSETLLTTHLLQYWTRTGDSQFLMEINVPPAHLIYPNMTSVILYSDGETMGFLYDGVQFFYPIVG